MTKQEIIQQMKNEALNKIRKIYHPLYNFPYDKYTDMSGSEQKEYRISEIIEKLDKDLESLKSSKSEIRDNKINKILN